VISALSSGVVTGLCYAFIAYGLAIVYRSSGYFNMAQGEICMFCGYVVFLVVHTTGSLLLAAVAAVLVGIATSAALQTLIIKRIQAADHFSILVATLAVGTVITEAVRLSINEGLPVSLPADLRIHVMNFGEIGGIQGVWITVMALLLAVALDAWLRFGRGGLALRAVGEAPPIAMMFGVAVPRVHLQAMAFAGLTAGLTGVILAVSFSYLTPYISTTLMFHGLAIVLVFGVTATWSILIGGVTLGLIEVSIVLWGPIEYHELITFLIIITVLLLRPAGVFRSRI
jgi:branched-chain amino acid transport system permease protein